ncbi:MAG: hypothetical protein LBI14_11885 [Treponema sp.]|jgi:hypothetical protein|nr:hypothetical protein [Treponema sp.]
MTAAWMPLEEGFRGEKIAGMTPRRRMAALKHIPIGKRPEGTYAIFSPVDKASHGFLYLN